MHLVLSSPPRPSLVLINHVILLTLFCFTIHGAASPLGHERDRQALLQFKGKIAGDPLGKLNSWNQTVHMCRWHGVTCGPQRRRVVSLELNSSKLVGSISPHVGNLSFLRVLDLSNNSFSHEIPQEVWDLRRLESLRLVNNSITGVLPSNMSCPSKLKVLHVGGNSLSGEIPDKLVTCSPSLRILGLCSNEFTGRLPPSLGNLSSLEQLFFYHNYMFGAIPESLGHLKNMVILDLADNGFSGTIPSPIFNLSKLVTFGVAVNQLEGSLPTDLGTKLPNIEVIYIERNQFTGAIPPSLSNATNLSIFVAADNKFTGSLPPLHKLTNLMYFLVLKNHLGSGGERDLNFVCSLVNATRLEILVLDTNNFGGAIPECVGDLSANLRILALEKNRLSGKIPGAIDNLNNLEWLSLQKNQLSGQIPSTIGSLNKLQVLYLQSNNLSGNIPFSFRNLSLLTKLDMHENSLEGSITNSMGECKGLVSLDISRNRLSGSIPPELFSLGSPFSIGMNLSWNRFTGNIPMQVGRLFSIGALDVSHNLLSGEIPTSLGSCESLEILNINNNLLEGTVPSLNSLRGIQELNISHNKFTGEIPKVLTEFQALKSLDLSYNDFEGVVPTKGIFMNSSIILVEGNKKLCGGISELQLPRCSSNQSKKKFSSSLRIAVSTVSALIGVALLALILVFFRLRRKPKRSESGKFVSPFMEISYQTLLKATDGFSSVNLMGAGSFGSVYKGVLNEEAEIVAVKVLNTHRKGASTSFIAECEALRVIRHRNILKIITVCSGVDYRGNDFKALVYEFMSNGSLEEWLHPDTKNYESNQKPRSLNLVQRISIALDIACALDYLHHQCQTPVAHCDLKPSNVLLDGDMTGCLGDFGLVRFLPEIALEKSSTTEASSIGIKGSIGYAAPEYGMGSDISTDGDVYSYGILLLEMFTGKRPTDEMFKEGLDLHKFTKGAIPEQVLEIVDPVILHEVEQMSTHRRFQQVQTCLISVIGIGVACSAEFPRERMNITDVVAQLSSSKDKLLGTRIYGRLR